MFTFLELYNKKIMDFTSSLDMEVDIHYVGQNNFEMRLYDHQGIEKMCIHLRGECFENFPGRPKWTRMNAQMDKRTYFGNIGLTK